jgi:hypothetical protein
MNFITEVDCTTGTPEPTVESYVYPPRFVLPGEEPAPRTSPESSQERLHRLGLVRVP